ncbi:sensor histidine kinase [Butyrivibrio fibrisolvens]|uniref:sensor histidine kinase n=1 Tax=Butyrivibrio fibrisolvens TaxID=831 RepID=UPI0004209FC7|nr:HAMP domain-containing sensor histidine kinase [Butyrivibrio fibrisolvens]
MSKVYKRSSHLLYTIGICVFSMIMISSIVILNALDDCGLMYTSGTSLKKLLMDQAAYDYSIWALSDKDGNYNEEFMNEKGCNIGIIETDNGNLGDLDLNDSSTYIYRNFDQELPAQYYMTNVYTSDDSEFYLSEKLYDFLFVNGNEVYNYDIEEYQPKDIKGIGYDMVGQKAYVWDGEEFIELNDTSYNYKASDDGGTYNTTNIYDRIWASQVPEDSNQHSFTAAADDKNQTSQEDDSSKEKNETNVITEDEEDQMLPAESIITTSGDAKILYIDGKAYPALGDDNSGYILELYGTESSGALSLSNVADLSDLHDQLGSEDLSVCTLDTVSSVMEYTMDSSYKQYTVITFPRPDQSRDSFFVQAQRYLGIIPVLHVALPLLMVISGILVLVLSILLVIRAGNYDDHGRLSTDILADFPIEVTFVIFGCVESLAIAVIHYSAGYDYNTSQYGLVVIGIGLLIGIYAGILWAESIIINFKRKQLFRNTLCYKMLRAMARPLRRGIDSIKTVLASIKWGYRIAGMCLVIAFVEYMSIAVIDDKESLMLFWLLEKVVLAAIIIKVLKQYAKVKKAAVDMADGNMDVRVDTTKMLIDLEEHGQALNKIGSGLNTAVNERMKSERMKTELITNVSHDIKTPLTSVINYVDLLQKENFDNETARSYLEVLDRQAKRLKKLIEDLIEASKAASGSIKFNMESVNARVLLNQSVGEFEDRLQGSNITVVTQIPDRDVYVRADNRYLFRVLDNLMSNIVKYSQEGTRAYVELNEDGGMVRYTFKNISRDKLGISADELMERFVRGDMSRNTEGNGLGLSIARSLTESMGGKMELTVDGDLFKVDVTFPEVVKESVA